MFDLGFSELLVIAVVALVVLGPERLPRAARFTGLWVRKARAQWYSVKSEFEREMAAEDLKRSIGDPARDLRGDVEDIRRELDETSAQAAATDEPGPADTDTGDTPSQPSLLPPRRDD